MKALRQIVDVTGQSLNIKLPDYFKSGRVEVIILPIEEEQGSAVQNYASTHQPNQHAEVKEPTNKISRLRGKLNLSKEQYSNFQKDIKKSRDEWESNI